MYIKIVLHDGDKTPSQFVFEAEKYRLTYWDGTMKSLNNIAEETSFPNGEVREEPGMILFLDGGREVLVLQECHVFVMGNDGQTIDKFQVTNK